MRVCFGIALLSMLFVATVSADDIVLTEDAGGKEEGNFKKERFTPFEPSFLLPGQASTPHSGESDDRAMEARFSFQYIFFNCNFPLNPSKKCLKNSDTFETSLSYTGEFDFYSGSRVSGPVINRISNPALNVSYKTMQRKWKRPYASLSKLGFSLEHRSNGQVVDVDDIQENPALPNFGEYLTELAYQNGNHEYFDTLSRGANFLTLKTRFHLGKGSGEPSICNAKILCANFWLSSKIYLTNDSNITWGELAGTNTSIKDYDIARLVVSDRFSFPGTGHPVTVEIDYTLGRKLFETDSIDVNLITPITYKGFNLPIVFRYHSGPMDRLSDYTREYKSFGIGLYLY